MSNRQRFLLLAGAVAIVTLAILVRDVIGATVVPFLLGEAWRIYTELSQTPQVLLWGGIVVVLITAGGIAALLSMKHAFESEKKTTGAPPPRRPGRVTTLATELDDVRRGPFFRRQLIKHLSVLTVAALEQRDPPSSREVARLLETDQLELSPELRAYLMEGRQRHDEDPGPNNINRAPFSLGLRRDKEKQAWREPQLEALVALMERELEVRYRDTRD